VARRRQGEHKTEEEEISLPRRAKRTYGKIRKRTRIYFRISGSFSTFREREKM